MPESDALAKLRTYLHALLADGLPANGVLWILGDRKYIQWNPDAPVWLDVDEYAALAGSDESQERALELYRGDLLDGIDDEWIISHRERLRARQVATLLTTIERSQRNGDFHKALEHAQRLLRDDPFHEGAVRAVISSSLSLGDRPGALRMYREFAARLKVEMNVEPMPATTRLFELISSATEEPATIRLRRTLALDAPKRCNNNLPLLLTSLVGRDSEIETLCKVLFERRLVTLTGAAGIGKSRLAIELARGVAPGVRDGVWLVELAPISDGALVAARISEAVDVPSRAGEPALITLLGVLRDREILILLDNCEHLLSEAAAVVGQLLENCPHVRVLATSREPLRLGGEFVERLTPLGLLDQPDAATPTLEQLREAPATRVFLERASDVDPRIRGGDLSDEDRRAVRTICARLDGLPLAIELAAARMNVLTPSALAKHLDDRFGILTAGSRGAEPRHQTLRAMLDWSYEMLGQDERRVFEDLGVFAGSWSLDAAAAVCAGDVSSGMPFLDAVSSLTEKSLIFPIGEDRSPRYAMLQTMRAYALERLSQDGRLDAVQRRHAEFWIAAAHAANGPDFLPDTAAIVEAMLPEIDNLREALAWSFGSASVSVAISLVHAARALIAAVMTMEEAMRWIRYSLETFGPGGSPEVEGDLRFSLAATLFTATGDSSALRDGWADALNLYRALPDRRKASFVLARMSELCWLMGNPAQARPYAIESLAMARETGDDLAIGYALSTQGVVLFADDPPARRSAFEEALLLVRNSSRPVSVARVLCAIAEAEFESGDAESALSRGLEALRIVPAVRSTHVGSSVLMNIPMYLNHLGRHREALSAVHSWAPEVRAVSRGSTFIYILQHGAAALAEIGYLIRAARIIGFCDARLQERGAERHVNELRTYNALMERLRAQLDEASLGELRREGAQFSEDDVLAQLHLPLPQSESAKGSGDSDRAPVAVSGN